MPQTTINHGMTIGEYAAMVDITTECDDTEHVTDGCSRWLWSTLYTNYQRQSSGPEAQQRDIGRSMATFRVFYGWRIGLRLKPSVIRIAALVAPSSTV